MQFSQDWYQIFSCLRGVLESEKQTGSDEIILKYLNSKSEIQEHCKDRTWIFCPWFYAKYFILVTSLCGLRKSPGL